jgi:hypothetical protein
MVMMRGVCGHRNILRESYNQSFVYCPGSKLILQFAARLSPFCSPMDAVIIGPSFICGAIYLLKHMWNGYEKEHDAPFDRVLFPICRPSDGAFAVSRSRIDYT